MLKLYYVTIAWQFISASFYPYSQIFLRNMGLSQSIIGVIISLGQISSCVVPIIIGNLVDKTGKLKQLYQLFVIILALCMSLIMLIPKLLAVTILFVIAIACCGSMVSMSDTLISKSVENTNKSYSSVRALGTFGYVCTLIFFYVIKYPDTNSNKQIYITLMTACALVSVALQIVPNPCILTTRKEKTERFNFKWFNKGFYYVIAILFVKTIANAIAEKLLGSYVTEVLHLGEYYSLFIALGAFAEFICMLIFGRLLNENKITELFLIVLSCIGIIIRLVLFALSTNTIIFIIAQLFHALTYGVSHIASMSYINKNVSKKHVGLATSIYIAIALNLSQFFGSFGGGFIIDNLGYPALFKIYIIFPVIALIMCFFMRKQINANIN